MNKYSVISYLVMAFLLSGCSSKDEQEMFDIRGVWSLKSVTDMDGIKQEYSNQDIGRLRIYEDSCYYECQTVKAPTGTMIVPIGTDDYTLIEKGKNDFIYLQGDGTHTFTAISDSSMMIMERGCNYMWRTCGDFDESKINSIVEIIKNDESGYQDASCRYVFSNAEQKLQTTNYTLIFVLIFVVFILLAILNYAYNLHKHKKLAEQKLREIEQEKRNMPTLVREAMNTVEKEFHESDFYTLIRRKIANGERLSNDDWQSIDEKFKSVYPRFTSTLLSLHNMSQIEYQVCLLLKLKSTPSEIARVLCKDTSTVSAVRSRLYGKIFGKKGSSKEWDEFIDSL